MVRQFHLYFHFHFIQCSSDERTFFFKWIYAQQSHEKYLKMFYTPYSLPILHKMSTLTEFLISQFAISIEWVFAAFYIYISLRWSRHFLIHLFTKWINNTCFKFHVFIWSVFLMSNANFIKFFTSANTHQPAITRNPPPKMKKKTLSIFNVTEFFEFPEMTTA